MDLDSKLAYFHTFATEVDSLRKRRAKIVIDTTEGLEEVRAGRWATFCIDGQPEIVLNHSSACDLLPAIRKALQGELVTIDGRLTELLAHLSE